MGKCSAEQRLAFLIPQVHHGLRTQVRWVAEVSAAREWKWQWALQLLWGWQAPAMAEHSLLTSCLPPGPPAQPAAAPNQSYQLQNYTRPCSAPEQHSLKLACGCWFQPAIQTCLSPALIPSCAKTFRCIKIQLSVNVGLQGFHTAIYTCK